MKDTAPGPDGIPYSVYNKLWEQAGPLVLNSWKYSNEKNELSREQQLSTIRALMLVGPTRENLILDPLVVQHLNNLLYLNDLILSYISHKNFVLQ